jgi:type IV pilus assembly protein PilM
MASPRFAWGIDIGNRALKAIKLVREGDVLRMDDVEVIEHEQVLSNSGDNRESLIQTALANFAQRHMTKGGVVAIGVSGQASFARFIKLPPVEEKKIPEIVKFEAIQQIPFPLDQVEWSYQLFRQTDSPDVEVGIFAMRKELVNQQIKYFTDMDMNVQVVQMSPLAVYNAMYYDNRLADGTTMILDLGAENADLIIAEGESVWLRSVPIGGNNFTEALVKAFKLNFSKAEELKRNAQTSKYARQIFQAMRPIFADLVAEIQRSIGFYSSVHRESRIKRIVALGNTFRLPTLQKYLQQNLQIEVDRLDAFHAGAPDDGRLAALLNDNIASMAGAYGLALQAMGQGKIESSLLPQEIRKAKIWQEKTKWFAAAAAVFLLGAGVPFGVYYLHNDKFQTNANSIQKTIDNTLSQAERNDREWTTIESSGGPDKARIINVNSLQQYRDVWGDLWFDITKALPAQNAMAPEKVAQIPRADRQQIFIESVNSRYEPQLAATLKLDPEQFKLLAQPSTGGGGGANAAAYVPAAAAGDRFSGGANFNRGGAAYDDGGRPIGRGRGIIGERGFVPTPVAPVTPVPTPGAAPAETEDRGYLVTIVLTSPNKNAPQLVDTTFKDVLLERVSHLNAFKDKKGYYIARAMIVSARQISSDEERKTKLKQDYTEKRAAAEKAALPLDQQQGFNPANLNRGAAGGDYARDRGPSRGGNFRGNFARNDAGVIVRPGTARDADKVDPLESEAFTDPLFPKEKVVNDWVITVVMAVVLDPKQPPEPVATPAQTASLDVADDRRSAAVAAPTATR